MCSVCAISNRIRVWLSDLRWKKRYVFFGFGVMLERIIVELFHLKFDAERDVLVYSSSPHEALTELSPSSSWKWISLSMPISSLSD